jgi:hypothetical protein
MLPKFTITRPAVASARVQAAGAEGAGSKDGRRHPAPYSRPEARSKNRRGRLGRAPILNQSAPGGLVPIFAWTAILTHLLGSLSAGTLDPGAWSPLLFWSAILFIAPCIALALAVVRGAFSPTGGDF